jgi:hypothetical protein
LVYCMNYIDHNFDWLEEKLEKLKGKRVLKQSSNRLSMNYFSC